jgi:hypothetical protein
MLLHRLVARVRTIVASDDCHHAYDEDVCEAWTWLRM